MKKLLTSFLLVAIMLFSVGIIASADPLTEVVDGITYTYTINNGEATITSVSRNALGDVVLPSELGGCPVTTIGESAFTHRSTDAPDSITIPETVTKIEKYAFYYNQTKCLIVLGNITSVGMQALTGVATKKVVYGGKAKKIFKTAPELIIGGEIEEIPDKAFSESSLKKVSISANVKKIGSSAFYRCRDLSEITLPESVEVIGDEAFYGCTGLSEITLPDSIEEIGNYAFYNTKLSSLILPGSLKKLGDAVLKNIAPSAGSTLKNLTWIGSRNFSGSDVSADAFDWEKIEYIGTTCFADCSNLSGEIRLNSLTEIGEGAFSGCTKLTNVQLPSTLAYIPDSLFNGCTNLTDITLPDSITSIGDSAFRSCAGLKKITVPGSVDYIGSSAFLGCTGLTDITIPDSVTDIGYSAFYGCTGLTDITIPNSVTSIGKYAFQGCTGLTDITISNSVTSIDSYTFDGCTALTSITLPDSLTGIGEYAFQGCSALTGITIPNSVTSIDRYAFYGCSALTGIVIPDGVTAINENTFALCVKLSEVKLPANLKYIYYAAFDGCISLAEINFPDSLSTISDSAFYGCKSLQAVELPPNLSSLSSTAFADCPNITEFIISEDNYNYATSGGVVYSKAGYDLISYPAGKKGDIFYVPEQVVRIHNYAFDSCSVNKIFLPSSVNSVSKRTFNNCQSSVYAFSDTVAATGLDKYNVDLFIRDGQPTTVYLNNLSLHSTALDADKFEVTASFSVMNNSASKLKHAYAYAVQRFEDGSISVERIEAVDIPARDKLRTTIKLIPGVQKVDIYLWDDNLSPISASLSADTKDI